MAQGICRSITSLRDGKLGSFDFGSTPRTQSLQRRVTLIAFQRTMSPASALSRSSLQLLKYAKAFLIALVHSTALSFSSGHTRASRSRTGKEGNTAPDSFAGGLFGMLAARHKEENEQISYSR